MTEVTKEIKVPTQASTLMDRFLTPKEDVFGSRKDKEIKYLLKDPKRPYTKEEIKQMTPKEGYKFIPDELKDIMSEEEYESMMGDDFESCEVLYQQVKKQISAPDKALRQVLDKENAKFHPYLPELEKFKTLISMVKDDTIELVKELNSIRALYKDKYLDENDQPKKDIPKLDTYFMELIMDIKLRYFVCGNRVKNVFEPVVKHISDFYSSMKFSYYLKHMDEAPEDIKKFLEERLTNYTNTEKPVEV